MISLFFHKTKTIIATLLLSCTMASSLNAYALPADTTEQEINIKTILKKFLTLKRHQAHQDITTKAMLKDYELLKNSVKNEYKAIVAMFGLAILGATSFGIGALCATPALSHRYSQPGAAEIAAAIMSVPFFAAGVACFAGAVAAPFVSYYYSWKAPLLAFEVIPSYESLAQELESTEENQPAS